MLTKICLVLAILASAGTIYLTHVQVDQKIAGLKTEIETAKGEAATANTEKAKVQGDLTKAQATIKDNTAKLAQAAKDVDAEKKKADAAEQAASKASDEAAKAKQETASVKASNQKFFDLKKTPEQITAAFADLAKKTTALTAIDQENSTLSKNNKALVAELDSYRNPYKLPVMTGLKGKVLSVDPKYNFVVIDAGAERGALLNGELKVSRGGQLVGRLKIVKVEKTYSIANVIAGTAKATVAVDILEGDLVLY